MASRAGAARQLVEDYLASFATGDPDRVADLVSEDFVNEHLSELGSGCVGRAEYRRRLPGFLEMFAGARYTVVAIVADDALDSTENGQAADGGQVVARYRFQADYEGIPIDVPGVMWFEVRDGRITRRTDLWDSLTFLRQTGQAD